MINITKGKLIFNQSGEVLDSNIRQALDNAANAILEIHNLESISIKDITTKTYSSAAYAKFAKLSILKKENYRFDESYVENVFSAYNLGYTGLGEDLFYQLTLASPNGLYPFRKTYGPPLRLGFGVFLIALHTLRAITLPTTFQWPYTVLETRRRGDVGAIVAPPILKFIRSLDSQSDIQKELAFSSISKNRREWFLCYGTKLLLATGWCFSHEANFDDLLAIKQADYLENFTDGKPLPYKQLVDSIERKYGKTTLMSVKDWTEALKSTSGIRKVLRHNRGDQKIETQFPQSMDDDFINEIYTITPSECYPDRLALVSTMPGLSFNISDMGIGWANLELAYLEKIDRESYKVIKTSMGYLNLYLLRYLPVWFSHHPDSELFFPDEPSKLVSGIYISKLCIIKQTTPLSLIEFMDGISQKKQWSPMTYYGFLKQIEKFFEFLERYSEQLPGCKNFKQPISRDDFPRVSRPHSTNKKPIPRRIFGFYLAYLEALIGHMECLLSRVIDNIINETQLAVFTARNNIIDTFKTDNIAGFIPVVFYNGKSYPLHFIPDCLFLKHYKLQDGREISIPQPHALYHLLVALHTGIRNNHIQWLDYDTFDKLAQDEEAGFTRLWVNTDKVKKTGWAAYVSSRVIDVLQKQKIWRDLIAEPGFTQKIYYNQNDKTKWEPFYALFSAGKQGEPHTDSRYEDAWKSVLAGVQGMLRTLGEEKIGQLCRLLPPGSPPTGPDQVAWLRKYGSNQKRVCDLVVKSEITPHSARVSVVSHLISILPADIIGKYITGQTPSVVYHYVKLEEEEIFRNQQLQHLNLRTRTFENQQFEEILHAGPDGNRHFIKANSVNSNLSVSIRSNLEETLTSYGCVSLTLTETSKNGIDVLRETRAENAAENKTEICPYGNQCPAEIIKQLKGFRRCALCQYAVRSIDHLPAIVAKIKQTTELLNELEAKLTTDSAKSESRYPPNDLDRLEDERQRLGEELTAWILNNEILEVMRQRIQSGKDKKKWLVLKPEIIEQDLRRVTVPNNLTKYVLSRLPESIAFPTMESPIIRARFDRLRRLLLAHSGKVRESLTSEMPVDPAAECLGLLRVIVEANNLSYDDLVSLLEEDKHLQALPSPTLRLLTSEL